MASSRKTGGFGSVLRGVRKGVASLDATAARQRRVAKLPPASGWTAVSIVLGAPGAKQRVRETANFVARRFTGQDWPKMTPEAIAERATVLMGTRLKALRALALLPGPP